MLAQSVKEQEAMKVPNSTVPQAHRILSEGICVLISSGITEHYKINKGAVWKLGFIMHEKN